MTYPVVPVVLLDPTWVPGRSSFQASNIGAVPQLRLRIASNIFVLLGFFEKQFMLLRSTLVTQSDLGLG